MFKPMLKVEQLKCKSPADDHILQSGKLSNDDNLKEASRLAACKNLTDVFIKD
jgi:hypothetical protein